MSLAERFTEYVRACFTGLWVQSFEHDDAIAASWNPAQVVEPVGSFDRERWADTLKRAEKWFPDLSAIAF